MNLVRLEMPGPWIDLPDRRAATEVERMMLHVAQEFCTANSALILFEEEIPVGSMPKDFVLKRRLIAARAFLYAIDNIDKGLQVLSKEAVAPPELANDCHALAEIFPDLRQVRNSAHHMEDRVRGLGRNGNRIQAKPIELPGIVSGGGNMFLDCVIGKSFASHMADGHLGRVEVSVESLIKLRELLHGVFARFEWIGSPINFPVG